VIPRRQHHETLVLDHVAGGDFVLEIVRGSGPVRRASPDRAPVFFAAGSRAGSQPRSPTRPVRSLVARSGV
jgi:hypothetical protein